MKKRNIVIGVGNMLFKDEGIGIYASEYIKQNYKFDDKELLRLASGIEQHSEHYIAAGLLRKVKELNIAIPKSELKEFC